MAESGGPMQHQPARHPCCASIRRAGPCGAGTGGADAQGVWHVYGIRGPLQGVSAADRPRRIPALAGRLAAWNGRLPMCSNNPVRLLLQTILDVSNSPYAQLLASSSLIKVITEHTLG
jgi:hypothetical protein